MDKMDKMEKMDRGIDGSNRVEMGIHHSAE